MSVFEERAATGGTAGVPRIGGVPVDVRLARLIPELGPRMVRVFAERLPSYAGLPAEELTGDVLRACEDQLRSAVRLLRGGTRPDSQALATVARSAAHGAERGIGLSALLSAYHLGWQLTLDALLDGADASELDDVRAVQRHALEQLRLVSAAVADVYAEHQDSPPRQRRAAHHAVLCALLDGTDPDEAARRAGLSLAPAYAVLTLAFGERPEEREPGASATAAERRTVRRAEAELDHHGRGRSLHALGVQGGRALLPVVEAESALGAGWAELAALVARLGSRTGAPVRAGVAAGPTESIAEAVRESAEVLEVVWASGRPEGAYRVTDVLLDYQLSRPGAAGRHLVALLAPLDGHRVLLATLTVYAESGFRRRETAAALHVHPHTVDYRLRRIALLTGLDPADSADLPWLHAALTVRRVGSRPLPRGEHPPSG